MAFALKPAATDTNGAHFRSVEAGSGPRLVVTWVPGEEPVDEEEEPDDEPQDEDDDDVQPEDEHDDDAPPKVAATAPGGCGCAGTPGAPIAVVIIGLFAVRRRQIA